MYIYIYVHIYLYIYIQRRNRETCMCQCMRVSKMEYLCGVRHADTLMEQSSGPNHAGFDLCRERERERERERKLAWNSEWILS